MFATKDHGEKFSGKMETAVETGKAKMSGMSRLSFSRVSVYIEEKKTKKGMERNGRTRERGTEESEEGGKVRVRKSRKGERARSR